MTIPVPFTAAEFIANAAQRRGRPIEIQSKDISISGLWLAAPDIDYILVDESIPDLMRAHVALHELAHILLDHRGISDPQMFASLFPDLAPDTIARALPRAIDYHHHEEREAEGLARVIPIFAARHRPVPRPDNHDRGSVAVMHRLSATVAADRTWR